MCGIFGVLSLNGHPLFVREQLEGMARALRHRGPNGTKLRVSSTFAVGATRLRIIDLHERADQPFESPGQESWLACNGEIYNAAALRRRFDSYPFRSGSDLEPLLPLLAAQGASGVAEIDGMFALAAWDARQRALVLARDRAGEKPLFYTELNGELWFASELAPLLLLGVSREIDPIALSQYLKLGYVLEPRTLFAAIRRVQAGTALVIRGRERSVHRYWEPLDLLQAPPPPGDRIARLRELIEASVRKQLVADVPVGVFASGGLDSSMVTMLASQAVGGERITTFSARFTEESYDESLWARRCAQRAGTQHVEVRCSDAELRGAFWELATRSAEPISDPAALPTLLLARAARQHVQVVLSGEGADELFGGYPTYLGHSIAPYYRALPSSLKRVIERGLAGLPASSRKVTFEFLLRHFVANVEREWVERHLAWFGVGLATASSDERTPEWLAPLLAAYRGRPPLSGAMLLDYCTSLREKLLVKSDRATMLNSIEARAPFLDWQLTAFAFSLPDSDKLRGLTTKWILKQAAMPLLPRAMALRRKRGLSVPIATLINGALREDVDRCLSSQALRAHNLLHEATVRPLLAEHRAGHANHARILWPAITLQYWAERWRPTMTNEVVAAPALAGVRYRDTARQFVQQ